MQRLTRDLLALGEAEAADRQAERHVLPHAEPREECPFLEDEALLGRPLLHQIAKEPALATGRLLEAGEQMIDSVSQ